MTTSAIRVQPQFIPVRYPDGRIAFLFDPVRCIVELQDRRRKYWFDLTQIIIHLPVAPDEQICYDGRQ
jgi:hypothetical protein